MDIKYVLLLCLSAITSAKPSFDFPPPISSRITGGEEALIGEFPHQATIHGVIYLKDIHFLEFLCGGIIINENWVLTAAYCLRPVPGFPTFGYKVKVGKHSIKDEEKFEQSVEVEEKFLHEKYSGDGIKNNIALLKLKKPLEFNERVQPIALPKANSDVDGEVILSGWGLKKPGSLFGPNNLQKAYVSVIDLETCANEITNIYGYSPLDENNLCTGSLEAGATTCSGDQGSPLIKVKENGKKELVGVVSWSYILCGTLNAPSVFTKVSAYVDWINNVISNY